MFITSIVDSGTAKFIEDAHHVAPPYIVVADGVSAPYDSTHPMRMFHGRTGGQLAARTLCAIVAEATPETTMDTLIEHAIARVGAVQANAGISLDRGELLGGAGFALARFGDVVEIATVADVFAIWRLRDGTVGATRDQVAAHDAYLRSLIPDIRKETGDDLDALFERLNPIRREARARDVNGDGAHAFGLLCGQRAMLRHVERHAIDRTALRDLILCSDGAVTAGADDPVARASAVFERIDAGGPQALLAARRSLEQPRSATAHAAHCEVTIVHVQESCT